MTIKKISLLLMSLGLLSQGTWAHTGSQDQQQALTHDDFHVHEHEHGEQCGHQKVQHGDHFDYLHDGHLHHPHGPHYDEHRVEESKLNPDQGSSLTCLQNAQEVREMAIPHGQHFDNLVGGRLIHVDLSGNCEDHGEVQNFVN